MGIAIKKLTGDGYAFETISVTNTAVGFTGNTWRIGDHTHIRAVVTATGGVMRYRYDGGDPTAGAGHLLSHGDMIIVEGSVNIVNFKAIRAGTENGILSVTYERLYG